MPVPWNPALDVRCRTEPSAHRVEQQVGDVVQLEAGARVAAMTSARLPSQNGQAVTRACAPVSRASLIRCSPVQSGEVGVGGLDARARPAAPALLPVPRHLDQLDSRDRLEYAPRRVVQLAVAAEVARVVVGDLHVTGFFEGLSRPSCMSWSRYSTTCTTSKLRRISFGYSFFMML